MNLRNPDELWPFLAAMVTAFLCSFLDGCASVPPDPQAPVVLTEPMQVTCPEPAPRAPPAELTQPLGLEVPRILPKGEGDYGVTRADLERIIDAHRATAARINQWKAWAQ